MNKRQQGDKAEDLALRFLQKQGLNLLMRNFNCRYGELDLVMAKPVKGLAKFTGAFDTVVVVEVRQRKSKDFGGAVASIDHRKQEKIRKAAMMLQSQKPEWANKNWRFDVLTVQGPQSEINWITSAFE